MNTKYSNLLKCLCIVIIILSGHHNAITQPGYTANDQVIPDTGPFEYGTNNGYYPGWSDAQLGDLGAGSAASGLPGVGATAMRPGLFEYFTEQFGNSINVPAYQNYQSLGMSNNTLFVGYASDAHKDPAFDCPYPYGNPNDPGAQTRVFKNMYTPIWDGGANGTPVNDDNYYALWLYQIVQIYGPYVKYWEIFNEPDLDFSSGGMGWRPPGDPAGNWWDTDPENCDIQFGAPIEYYNRMMRISWEIIKTYDPGSYVAVGGLGFPSFLDAMMRNTDNPVDGSVTPEYPLLGGAYFDCLSFHSYPHINGSLLVYNNQTGVLDPIRNTDMAVKGIVNELNNFKNVMSTYGYGTTYPDKEVIMTESNIPRKKIANYIGSEEAQYNYLAKLPVILQRENVNQFYVYDLGEKKSFSNATHPFDVTGLYEDLVGQTYSTVVRTNGGISYKTVSDQLYEKTYDVAQTAAMNLPPDIDGAAFKHSNSNNEFTYVLWAVTQLDDSEFASATYSFPSSFNLDNLEKIEWNFAATNQKTFISSQNIALTGSPIFLSETNNPPPVNCPQNITVEASNGSTQVVTWNNPSASTSCPNGAINVSQTSGAGNGSSFPIGQHTIAYSISDNCGNTQSCSFTITVTSPIILPQDCPNGQVELTVNVLGYGSVDIEYYGPTGPTDNCNSTCTYCLQSGTVVKLVPKPNPGEVFLSWTGNSGCGGNGDCWKTISWETEITAQFTTNGPPPNIPPTISATETNVSCNGLSDGNINTAVQNGTPSFSYNWNSGQTTQNLNNVPAGTYTVTVTDANGQTASISKTINEPTPLVGQILTQTDVSCSGVADGSATAAALGGEPPYSYIWSSGVGSATASGLVAGNYTVTIYDSNACSTTATVTISGGGGSAPVADFSKTISGTTVDFTDLSSGNPSSWAWDFGDGNTGLGATPSHTYAAAGTYLACLSAGNSCGQNTFCQNISAGQNNEVLLSMGTASGNAGTIVQIALSLEGFENIVSFQHAISIVDTTKAEFVNIGSFDSGLMNVNPPTTNVSPESISVVWLSSGSPVTIADGTALYILDILIKGDPNECVDIVIDETITPTEFIMLDNGSVVQVPFNVNNSQVCSSAGVVVSGLIASETGLPIEYVEVYNGGNLETETNFSGVYEFPPYTSGSNFVIEPHKDINHVNGVTSFDLAVIQQHIVGNANLSSPYKLIAADINASGQISAFDLFLAQQVIVGNDSIFPGNESWRFVPTDHVFSDPNNPWAGNGFPESITLNNVITNMPNQDFVAIKIGDVTDSAVPNDSLGNITSGDARSSTGSFEFLVDKKRNTVDGSSYIEFMAKDFTQMSAFQFDLIFDKNKIEFEKIESDAINLIHGIKLLENGTLTLVWYDKSGDAKGKSFEDGTALFRIYFNELTTTLYPIQQLFGITEATTLPNAYTSDGSPKEIYLKPFISETPKSTVTSEFEILQNRPNPFSEKTDIIFYLPVEDQVQIEVFDVQGKVVHRVDRNFSAGKNMVEINSDDLPHTGIYYFRIQTSSFDRVQKMIFIE